MSGVEPERKTIVDKWNHNSDSAAVHKMNSALTLRYCPENPDPRTR